MPDNLEQAELLAQVAQLYFENGQDQAAIARRLRVSRSSISRLLTEARRRGIVEIRIHYPLPTAPAMAEQLQQRFGLQDVIALQARDLPAAETLRRVSVLAAKYLDEKLRDGDTLALSWGTTLHAVAQHFNPARHSGIQVVQLVGTLDASHTEIDGGNLVRKFASALHAKSLNLNAPLLVESAAVQRALTQEPSIKQVLDSARDAAIALVGIGSLARGASSAVRARMLSPALMRVLRDEGAVGDICSRYINLDGALVAHEVNARVVGLELEALKEIPLVIGVAVGAHKAKAILGALRGGYLSALVVDEATAQRVLRFDDECGSKTNKPQRAPRTQK